MAFERFTKAAKSYEPIVSIRRNGQLGFNQGAYEKFHLDRYKYVVLFYDRDSSRIGVKLTAVMEEGAIPLRVKKTNTYVAIKPFLDYYDIPYKDKTKRFRVEWDKEQSMMIFAVAAEEG